MKEKIKKPTFIIILAIGILSGIILLYQSYALFTTNTINKSAITIKAGTLEATILIDGKKADKIEVPANWEQTYIIKITNEHPINGKELLYYFEPLKEGVTIGYVEGTGIDVPPKEEGIVLSSNASKTYTIKVKNTSTSSQTISLGVTGGLENDTIMLPSGTKVFEPFPKENGATTLIEKANDETIKSYVNGDIHEMYTFTHSPGNMQEGWTSEELTDYRYIGNDPYNYIYFNCSNPEDTSTCEIWRIIGIFTVEDAQGNKERRMKIMKNESIGVYQQVNTGSNDYYIDWTMSEVKMLLNGSYYSNLQKSAKKVMDYTKLYLGRDNESGSDRKNAEFYYVKERTQNSELSKYYQHYLNQIALINKSDYGYTYALGVNSTCYNDMYYCSTNPRTGWMYNIMTNAATNSGLVLYFNDTYCSDVYKNGSVSGNGTKGEVIPSLYLKSNIEIIDGTGEQTNPYHLSYNIEKEDNTKTYTPKHFTQYLLSIANNSSVITYEEGKKEELYPFKHTAGVQQAGYTEAELTDYRYIGNMPNNYVYFNCYDPNDKTTCEIWRMIGVFTVEDANGTKEQRIKLIRHERLGYYLYDNKNKTGSADTAYGSNEWSDARLNTILNDLYYQQKVEDCSTTGGYSGSGCNFSLSGLNENAKKMIKEAKWYLGGISNNAVNADIYYEKERGVEVYTKKVRSTSYISNVALPYPSDFGYTLGYGINDTCYNSLNNCKTAATQTWINTLVGNYGYDAYTMTPDAKKSHIMNFFDRYQIGRVSYNTSSKDNRVYPTVYLKPDVQLLDGNGSMDNPYFIREKQ